MADVEFTVDAKADSSAVEKLTSKINEQASAVQNLNRQLEEWRRLRPGGVEPGMQIRTFEQGGHPSGPQPGGVMPAGGYGIATDPKAIEEAGRAASTAAPQIESLGRSGRMAYGSMRALRAAMYELSGTIPGLSQALTIGYYGLTPGLAAVAAIATTAGVAIRGMITEIKKFDEVIGSKGPIVSLKGMMEAVHGTMAKAKEETFAWEQSLDRTVANLERIHQANTSINEQNAASNKELREYNQHLGQKTATESAIEEHDAQRGDRQKKIAEDNAAEMQKILAFRRAAGLEDGEKPDLEAMESKAKALRQHATDMQADYNKLRASGGTIDVQRQLLDKLTTEESSTMESAVAYSMGHLGGPHGMIHADALKHVEDSVTNWMNSGDIEMQDKRMSPAAVAALKVDRPRRIAYLRQRIAQERARLGGMLGQRDQLFANIPGAGNAATSAETAVDAAKKYTDALTAYETSSATRAENERTKEKQFRRELAEQLRETPEGLVGAKAIENAQYTAAMLTTGHGGALRVDPDRARQMHALYKRITGQDADSGTIASFFAQGYQNPDITAAMNVAYGRGTAGLEGIHRRYAEAHEMAPYSPVTLGEQGGVGPNSEQGLRDLIAKLAGENAAIKEISFSGMASYHAAVMAKLKEMDVKIATYTKELQNTAH